MALYTVFAWTAIVVVGGAYYWLYIRREVPKDFLGLSKQTEAKSSSTEDTSIASSQKQKRKPPVSKRRSAALQTNELLTGGREISGNDREHDPDHANSTQQVHDEGVGLASNRQLKGIILFPACCSLGSVDVDGSRKQAIVDQHFTASDTDESDALNTPTPAPSKKPSMSQSGPPRRKTAAESHYERTISKTPVDDMIPDEDRPKVARVMRISSPLQPSTTPSKAKPPQTQSTDLSGPAIGKDGLTKKQRQNQKKKERHREARAREEAVRQEQLRAHQRQLEMIRLNSQIKASENQSSPPNIWQHSGPPAMEDSVYTIRNLSDENLTTVGHRSDGAASEEGWQEVTSKAAKKAAAAAAASKSQYAEPSDEISSDETSEDGSTAKGRPAYASSNSFADLDS